MNDNVIRRRFGGCEKPGKCDWPRVNKIDPGCESDYRALKLCDFHSEVIFEQLSRSKAQVSTGRALSRHVASWRARK